jgi:hypothetical protein
MTRATARAVRHSPIVIVWVILGLLATVAFVLFQEVMG